MAAGRASADEVSAIGVFAGLDGEALAACAGLSVRRELSKRQIVFAQGDPCERFQALLAGGVRISQAGRDGGQALIRLVGPGEPFGSFGMFIDGYYPAEAAAIVPSTELSWSKAHFQQLMGRFPTVAINLVSLAAHRLATLQERLREITTMPVDQRIASALLRLAQAHGRQLDDGAFEIVWPVTRKDIAALSTTTLFTASRVLTRWEREGLLRSVKRRLVIASRLGLGPDCRRVGVSASADTDRVRLNTALPQV